MPTELVRGLKAHRSSPAKTSRRSRFPLACRRKIFPGQPCASLAEAERLRQSLLADAGRGDLLKTIIDRVEGDLLKEVKRARGCFDALVGGRIGSVAGLASLEGISDRYEAVASVVI